MMMPDTVVLFPPNPTIFREAIEEGVLSGTVEKRDFIVKQAQAADRVLDEEARQRMDGNRNGGQTDLTDLKTTVLDDQDSFAAFVDAELVGRQFIVDMPIVLRKLTVNH